MVEKILNNTTPYGKIRASHEGSLHSSTLKEVQYVQYILHMQILEWPSFIIEIYFRIHSPLLMFHI